MPMNRENYPENWEEIALKIKTDAEWTCQWCKRPCRRPKESDIELIERIKKTSWDSDLFDRAWSDEHGEIDVPKLGRFTLTTAHLNHDPENPEAELAALCSVCHCRYDLKQMRRKRQIKAERSGQLRLFDETRMPPEKGSGGGQ